jgi:NAD(P)-dependent dehydrogenase (short-subunit alcohol dehydrogenase family)
MIVSKGNLTQDSLKGEVALVTGAGRGIGFEAARALIWLGANVIIAEIDEKNGKAAEDTINKEFGASKAFFVKTDIGNEKDIDKLYDAAQKKFGKVDVVLNNATVFPMGAVKDTPIESWDFSYRVNLRGPVVLARKFLAAMIERKHGVFVCVSSSGAAPFMGAYEVFKTAQVELSNTISAEVEGTGVYAFTIGPGICKTPGFIEGGGKVASLMGMSLTDLFELNKNAQISPEAAGAGFAIAVALSKKYHGKRQAQSRCFGKLEYP